MISSLASLAAGFALFYLLLLVLEKDKEVRAFWARQTLVASILGVVLWKLTPIWTRWEVVFSNPLLLISMNGGLAALLGGLAAFAAVLTLSLMQIRKGKAGIRKLPLILPIGSALVLVLAWNLLEPVVFPPAGNDPGPALEVLVPDLEGRKHALSDWKGKIVVINFWATGSVPSQAELPELKAFTKKGTSRVVIVGVNLLTTEKDGESGVVKFAAKNRMTWAQLLDPEGTLQKAFAVTSVPTSVVLNAAGRVVDRRVGTVDLFWLQTLEVRYGQ